MDIQEMNRVKWQLIYYYTNRSKRDRIRSNWYIIGTSNKMILR